MTTTDMEINGRAYCFFEQSGTFKREFIKLGIPAEDYDIQNHFGETDHVCDLFAAIEDAYDGRPSLFDEITPDDIIMAFFPCTHFCDAKTMIFKGWHIAQRGWTVSKVMEYNIELENDRHTYFVRLMQLTAICGNRGIRLVVENPWNTSGMTHLQTSFIDPTIIDRNRTLRGDRFVKPTAYWFINCEPTRLLTVEEQAKDIKTVCNVRSKNKATGMCDDERSMIAPDYARNFICDFLIGKAQRMTQLNIFDYE